MMLKIHVKKVKEHIIGFFLKVYTLFMLSDDSPVPLSVGEILSMCAVVISFDVELCHLQSWRRLLSVNPEVITALHGGYERTDVNERDDVLMERLGVSIDLQLHIVNHLLRLLVLCSIMRNFY